MIISVTQKVPVWRAWEPPAPSTAGLCWGDITAPARTAPAWKWHRELSTEPSVPVQGVQGAHTGPVWDPALLGRRRNNPTHLPHTELPHLSPLRHSVPPECHTVQQPAAITMASINNLPSSLWKDFLFSLFQGLISFCLCHSLDRVLPFFSKRFGTDASTTGFKKPGYFFILSLYSTQHDRGPLHPSKY